MSQYLHTLSLNQCNLSGRHAGLLMTSMARTSGEGRELHLQISANRLEKDHGDIVDAIEKGCTPTQLTMRMVEYQKEVHFRQLLQALRTNKTIRCLDISKASLPYDAGDETCTAMLRLFAENSTIEFLDISGEHAHLEVARFGIGLNNALSGLRGNKALQTLRIEYQNLGLEGANTLSSVLEENDTLRYIYCEHNDINLQGFTVLVNALAKNNNVLYLPIMSADQGQAAKRMMNTINESRLTSAKTDAKHTVRRALHKVGVQVQRKDSPVPTLQDVEQAVAILNQRWENQLKRLSEFLERNNNIFNGELGMRGDLSHDMLRPSTAMSDYGILEQVLSETTPRIELSNPVDNISSGKKGSVASLDLTDRSRRSFETDHDTASRKTDSPQLPELAIGKGVFEWDDDDIFDAEN